MVAALETGGARLLPSRARVADLRPPSDREGAAAGLSDAAIERFPADGKTLYAHFRSYLGWNPVSAALEEVSPRPRLIASFPDLPVALADYSQDADVTAELVDVGRGTDAKSYDGKDVRGKIVLADGPLPGQLACEERGAAGFLSDFPISTRPGPAMTDSIRASYQATGSPSWSRSVRPRSCAEAAAGERSSQPECERRRPGDVATILGTDSAAGEIVLTAHPATNQPAPTTTLPEARPLSRPGALVGDSTRHALAAQAHDPFPVAARDHRIASLSGSAPGDRRATDRGCSHGHGRRAALDHARNFSFVAHSRDPASRR
jgi:hypothetical protein